MLKYTIELNGNVTEFINTFTKGVTDIFSNIEVSVDTSNQTRINLVNTTTNALLCYFYVENTLYNSRNTLLIKTYGLTIYPTNYQQESTADWGPQILYKNSNNVLCSRAGFITSASQKFLIDSITLCLDDNNVSQYFIAFNCNENTEPVFIISPTNLGNVGFIGMTANNTNTIGLRLVTFDNSTTVEHNFNLIRINNSSVTSFAQLFIPESLNSEYFEYLYIITALENVTTSTLQYNNHIYMCCFNNCIAALIY